MLTRAEDYLAHRRRLGFKLKTSGTQTISFARFADGNGHNGALTSEIALRWAKDDATCCDPFTWAQRLEVLRPFAAFLVAEEPTTTFPAINPFGGSYRRLAPHIFTDREIGAILAEARQVSRVRAAGVIMLPPLIGLLASTGLRISEALGLRMHDLDLAAAQILIRNAKFGRQRVVVLHPTVVAALENFINDQCRAFRCGASEPLFKSELTGGELTYANVFHTWKQMTLRLGIMPRGGHPFVRIHDLRHTFICRRLLQWQASGTDIDAAMMMLSTYVGHVNLRDTYWYLEAVPELMALAGDRFETHAADVRGGIDG
ncbi:tyrosine-type recombinase/integrase [Rhizobium leguminosarum]|uniref:Tyrosine-type recombinase/integrase n=1 Tax=Rhizobium leguminosarum TaxID=384 RepID=A0A7K3VRN0_RHILE|nr:tyrosine-type recombinase/integrase [Rhizobium leguminosarum]NEK19492.1 tyrosine-type recombinase/integrase [Rhizobium leguminosarum]